MNKVKLSNTEIFDLAYQCYSSMLDAIGRRELKLFAIPRGGIPVSYAIAAVDRDGLISIVEKPEDADFFMADIIDSGETMKRYCDRYPGKPFFALVDKTDPACPFADAWITFPWEDDGNKAEELK